MEFNFQNNEAVFPFVCLIFKISQQILIEWGIDNRSELFKANSYRLIFAL